MRKTQGYILMGFNFIVDENKEVYCQMELHGNGEVVYEKYKVDHESSLSLQDIANKIYLNNEQIK